MSLSTLSELEAEIAARKAHLAHVDEMRIALASATIESTETLESIAKDEEVKPNLRVRASDRILTYHEKFEDIECDKRIKNLEAHVGIPGSQTPEIPSESLEVQRVLRVLLEQLMTELTKAAFVAIATLSTLSKDSDINPDIRIRASERLLAYHAKLSKRAREEARIRNLEIHYDAQRQAAHQSRVAHTNDHSNSSTDPVSQQSPGLRGDDSSRSTDSSAAGDSPRAAGSGEGERWSLGG